MKLNTLQPPKGATHKKKRVGRGEGSGNGVTAGRGHKGQQSRSGYSRKRGFEGGQMPLHRRVPKRGFHNPFRIEYATVNLDTLSERFADGTEITPALLKESGVVSQSKALIKVLARGEISKKLVVKAHRFSAKASQAITDAGGSVEVIVATVKDKSL